MSDLGLEKYIKNIEQSYGDIMSETEVCKILNFNKAYFCRLRKSKQIIPFIKIGLRISYLKHDVIDFIKNNRKKDQKC